MSSGFLPAASAPSLHGGDELVLVQLLALTGGADEAVTGAARVLGHLRAAGGDVDRDAALGHVVNRGALGVVVLALEVDPVAQPQLTHQPHRFAQPRVALLELRPFALVSGGDLVERLPGADAEEDPIRVETAHGRERLRDDGRVVAERRRQHRRTKLQPLGPLADRRHPSQRERRVPALVTPRLEVVADRCAVHAVRFGGDRQLDEFPRRELLRRRLISKFEFSHAVVSTPLSTARDPVPRLWDMAPVLNAVTETVHLAQGGAVNWTLVADDTRGHADRRRISR